jgi:hypothetical protein
MFPGGTANTGSLARSDRKTGVPPVREDSASSLSAHETTGWKPVVHDRLEACPPPKLRVLGGSPGNAAKMAELPEDKEQRVKHQRDQSAFAAGQHHAAAEYRWDDSGNVR